MGAPQGSFVIPPGPGRPISSDVKSTEKVSRSSLSISPPSPSPPALSLSLCAAGDFNMVLWTLQKTHREFLPRRSYVRAPVSQNDCKAWNVVNCTKGHSQGGGGGRDDLVRFSTQFRRPCFHNEFDNCWIIFSSFLGVSCRNAMWAFIHCSALNSFFNIFHPYANRKGGGGSVSELTEPIATGLIVCVEERRYLVLRVSVDKYLRHRPEGFHSNYIVYTFLYTHP